MPLNLKLLSHVIGFTPLDYNSDYILLDVCVFGVILDYIAVGINTLGSVVSKMFASAGFVCYFSNRLLMLR